MPRCDFLALVEPKLAKVELGLNGKICCIHSCTLTENSLPGQVIMERQSQLFPKNLIILVCKIIFYFILTLYFSLIKFWASNKWAVTVSHPVLPLCVF